MSATPAPAASLGRRAGSLCYDALLIAAILFFATWIFLGIQPLVPDQLARPLLQLYLVAVCGAYLTYCWSHSGQTLPMKTWRIRVVTRAGESPGARVAILRYVFALLSVALVGAGFWWALFDRDRQFLHDRLVGTRLVMNAG